MAATYHAARVSANNLMTCVPTLHKHKVITKRLHAHASPALATVFKFVLLTFVSQPALCYCRPCAATQSPAGCVFCFDLSICCCRPECQTPLVVQLLSCCTLCGIGTSVWYEGLRMRHGWCGPTREVITIHAGGSHKTVVLAWQEIQNILIFKHHEVQSGLTCQKIVHFQTNLDAA